MLKKNPSFYNTTKTPTTRSRITKFHSWWHLVTWVETDANKRQRQQQRWSNRCLEWLFFLTINKHKEAPCWTISLSHSAISMGPRDAVSTRQRNLLFRSIRWYVAMPRGFKSNIYCKDFWNPSLTKMSGFFLFWGTLINRLELDEPLHFSNTLKKTWNNRGI